MSRGCGAAAVTQTHVVLIPSYNSGRKLYVTVVGALAYWPCVWVVVDGSTDNAAEALTALHPEHPGLRVMHRADNGGKGAAVLTGLYEASTAGFTHALVMDADGQHPADSIPEFLDKSMDNPDAMILGVPVFEPTAPRIRVLGRRISNSLARLETQCFIGDALFGFRVYPVASLLAVMESTPTMRGYDFDTEAVVRLSWRGVRAINLAAPVRYFRPEEGGVSHFRYGRDNFLLAAMHAKLIVEFLTRKLKAGLRKKKESSSFCEQKEPKKLF